MTLAYHMVSRVKPYVVMNWTAAPGSPIRYPNIQDLVIHQASNDGLTACTALSNTQCVVQGEDFHLCQKSPEAHFVFQALVNWANYLETLHNTLNDDATSLTPSTSALVKQFFTTQPSLNNLLVPVGIVSGIAGGISGFLGPVAVIAGAGAITNALIVNAGLNRVE